MNRFLVVGWVKAPSDVNPRITGTYYGLQVDADTQDAAVAAVRRRYPTIQIRSAQIDLVMTDPVVVLNSFPTED